MDFSIAAAVRRFAAGAALAALAPTAWGASSTLEAWTGCRFADAASNDGDSFTVRRPDGSDHQIRLYFVDAPEPSADNDVDQRRMRSQAAYFGLISEADVLRAGREAAAFSSARLARPFAVHTCGATAMGRGRMPRIYAFVRTADGADLGELLVGAGLARAYGVGRETPEKTPRDEAWQRLRDIELAAALRRDGIWRHSDPKAIVERRAAVRAEAAELHALGLDDPTGPVAPNTDAIEALMSLPGIGPILAERIVAHRPYRCADDLRRVPGIGPATLDRIRDRLVFPAAPSSKADP